MKKRYISVVLSENVSFLSWLLWMLHRIEMATFAGDCGQCVSSRGVWREEKQNRLLDLELIIGIRWKLHWERGRCSSLQNNPTSIWYKKENPKLKERERERERNETNEQIIIFSECEVEFIFCPSLPRDRLEKWRLETAPVITRRK